MNRFPPSPRGAQSGLGSSRWLGVLLLAALALTSFTPGRAGELSVKAGAGQGSEPMAPVQVEADHMESDQNKNSVAFTGKVVAKQGKLTIRTESMTVFYEPGGESASEPGRKNRQIQRLLCAGQVEISQGEWVASGDQGEYFSANRKLILTGNTKVWQNGNMVTGDRFVIFLDEGKSFVERNPKKGERVKAFFSAGEGK